MDTLMLLSSFLSALIVSGGVVYSFSRWIGKVLSQLLPAETAAAWSLYCRFALFVAALVGGVRLDNMEALLSAKGKPPLTAAQTLLEVFRSATGSLKAAVSTLLIIFGAALMVSVIRIVYARFVPEKAQPERESAPGEALVPVGSGRHARGREPQQGP